MAQQATIHPGPIQVLQADGMQFQELIPGVTQARLWGNPERGDHGCMTRFQPGQDNPMHYHTHDLHLLVLEGAYLYRLKGGQEVRVGRGCYAFIPGGVHHWSGGDPKEGALFLECSSQPFDLVPLQGQK